MSLFRWWLLIIKQGEVKQNLMELDYKWTNGTHEDFQKFYQITENYYNEIVGGINNRKSFVP